VASNLGTPAAFDATEWSQSQDYRDTYLAEVDPTRIWQSAAAGPSVPRIRADGERYIEPSPSTNVAVSAVAAANAPVTFHALGEGSFTANGSNVVTVVSDSYGVASVTFAAPARGRIPILAASPTASGQLRIIVSVVPSP
jgi:hypothetical protein